MTEKHPMDSRVANELGVEFYNALSGAVGTQRCDDTPHHARTLLADRSFDPPEIEKFVAYFREHGGYCDCEILMNCDFLFDTELAGTEKA